MSRRVVITGLGAVTPAGIGKSALLTSITNAISPVTRLNIHESYGNLQGAEIKDFNLDSYFNNGKENGFDRKSYNKIRNLDRAIQFAVLGTKLAIEDSSLQYDQADNSIGVCIGNAEDCIQLYEIQVELTIQKVVRKIFGTFSHLVKPFHFWKTRRIFNQYQDLLNPEKLPEFIAMLHEKYGTLHQLTPTGTLDFKSYAIPSRITSFFGLHGPSSAINTSCASGLDAIGFSFRQIKDGYCDVIISGGSEAPISLESLAALDNLGVISKTKPCPYDKNRDGFALSEGAGILVLEELEHAKARGAHIYAEICGFGQSTDANKNIFALNLEGRFLKEAINQALKLSGISSEKVDYINSHGTSTQDCDEIETAVVKEIFGNHAYRLFMSSTKPITGHSIGAIGGIEAIITSLAIENSIIPPTLNLANPDPKCDLNYAPNKSIQKNVDTALITSMGFGGFNSALVLSKLK